MKKLYWLFFLLCFNISFHSVAQRNWTAQEWTNILKEKLQLTDTQSEKVQLINETASVELETLSKKEEILDAADVRAKKREINQKRFQAIRRELDETQKEKLKSFIESLRK